MKIKDLSIADLIAICDYCSKYYQTDVNYYRKILNICTPELDSRLLLISKL